MTFDVGIELRRKEIATEHVAFELGHIDAVGRETAERLVEGGWHVAHAEYESRDDLAVVGLRPSLLAREHDEARRRMGMILDVFLQNLKAVDFRRQPRGDRRARDVPAFRHLARRTGRIGSHDRLEPELTDDVATLAERHDVTF